MLLAHSRYKGSRLRAVLCPALIPAPGTWTDRTGAAAAEKFKAMESLSLGIEVLKKFVFLSLFIGMCDVSMRNSSIFSVLFVPSLPTSSSWLMWLLTHAIGILLGWGCISPPALHWVQPKSGKSQKI